MTESVDILNMREWELDRLIIETRKSMQDKPRRFAEYVAAGMPQYKAYMEAGYVCKDEKTAESSSSRVVRNAKVAHYLELLRERQRRNASVTHEAMMRRFMDAGDAAMRAGDFTGAKQHWREAALLADLYPALKKHIQVEDKTPMDGTQMSDEAWIAMFEMRRNQKAKQQDDGDGRTTH